MLLKGRGVAKQKENIGILLWVYNFLQLISSGDKNPF
jgi:hypothetical protein